MATDATQRLAEGEPATDLVEALDELLARTRRERPPLDLFYAELHEIYAEVCRRLGKPEPTERLGGGNVQKPPGYIDDGSPEEDAHELWCAVRIMAVNRCHDGPYLSNDEFWAEFEDELGAYDPDEPVDFNGAPRSPNA